MLATAALPQATSNAGDVRGTVVDATAQAVPERRLGRATQVGAAGEFAIPLVPPGVDRFRVEAAGFATKVLEGVEVRVGDVVTLTVEMSLGAVATEVIVTDDASFRPIQTPTSGLCFGGSNGRGNSFFIDGLENYGVSGGVRPTFPQEAPREFQIAIGASLPSSFTAPPDHSTY